MSLTTGRVSEPEALRPDDIIRVLGKGWLHIFVWGLAGLILSAAYVFLLAPKVYEAEVLINSRVGQLHAAGGLPLITESPDPIDDGRLNLEVSRLINSGALQKLVVAMDLTTDPEFNTRLVPSLRDRIFGRAPINDSELRLEVVDRVAKHVSAASPPDSQLIRLTVHSTDPEKAADLANKLGQIYLASQARSFLGDAGISIPNLVNAQDSEQTLKNVMASLRRLAQGLNLPKDLNGPELRQTLDHLQATSQAALLSYALIINQTEGLLLQKDSVEVGITRIFGEMLQVAVPASAPVSPAVGLSLAFGLVLGLIMGTTTVLWNGFVNMRLLNAQMLEGLFDRPLLGALPGPSAKRSTKTSAEAFGAVRAGLVLRHLNAPVQVLLLTSADPLMRLDLIAHGLAQSYHRSGKKVLIVETIPQPDTAGSATAGLEDYLSGETSLAQAIQQADGVGILRSGDAVRVSDAVQSEVFASSTFAEKLTEMRSHADVVILVAAAVSHNAQTAIAEPLTDMVLLAVTPGQTLVGDIKTALYRLGLSGRSDIGFVLVGDR